MKRSLPGSGVLPLALLLVFSVSARAEVAPISLDGDFADWSSLAVDATDTAGDSGSSGIDFGRVWVANDHNFLFVRFETGVEVQGDEQQDMRLYLDTDMNAGTGTSYGGIGADLVWDFGIRSGSFRGSTVRHDDLGMLLAPTVSSSDFEIAFALDATPNGQALFPGSQVRLILRDMASGGDRVPDASALTVTIDPASTVDPEISFARESASHLRIASYNVLSDGLFDAGSREQAFTRILGAIGADVWIFNEVWNHDAAETAARLEQLLPAGPGYTWHAVKRDQGNVIVSRHPIIGEWDVLPGSRLTAVRVDLSPDHDRDLVVIAAHLSCCTADAQRQDQADALIAFVRDAQTPGGAIDVPADTPIVAGGDFNLVGWRQQLDTIVTGDIQDEGAFGADHAPDWDGSSFDFALSTHTDQRVGYTWRNDNSSFLPGVLDFLFYTGSVVQLGNDFIVDTRTMSASRLAANGLQASDTVTASDHGPRVLDLVLEVGTDAPTYVDASLRVLAVAPNPFNPRTVVSFEVDRAQRVAVEVVDLQGRHVRTLLDEHVERGTTEAVWNGEDDRGRPVASGTYLFRLRGESGERTAKAVLVR